MDQWGEMGFSGSITFGENCTGLDVPSQGLPESRSVQARK